MNTAFLDTLYVLALANADDEHHQAALELQRHYRGRLITTEYVLIEVLDALTSGSEREIGMALVASIRRDKNVETVPASTQLFDQGLSLFAQHADKDWGITDCISFAVMRDRGLTDALTADHHFAQAGFHTPLQA